MANFFCLQGTQTLLGFKVIRDYSGNKHFNYGLELAEIIIWFLNEVPNRCSRNDFITPFQNEGIEATKVQSTKI